MRLGLFIMTMALLGGCAAQQAAKPETSKTSNTLSQDAYQCEQKAALAGVGTRAAAFDDCMKTKGRTPTK